MHFVFLVSPLSLFLFSLFSQAPTTSLGAFLWLGIDTDRLARKTNGLGQAFLDELAKRVVLPRALHQ